MNNINVLQGQFVCLGINNSQSMMKCTFKVAQPSQKVCLQLVSTARLCVRLAQCSSLIFVASLMWTLSQPTGLARLRESFSRVFKIFCKTKVRKN